MSTLASAKSGAGWRQSDAGQICGKNFFGGCFYNQVVYTFYENTYISVIPIVTLLLSTNMAALPV